MSSHIPNIIVISEDSEFMDAVDSYLNSNGFRLFAMPYEKIAAMEYDRPDLLLIDIASSLSNVNGYALARMLKSELRIPIIFILTPDFLDDFHSNRNADDFILKPCNFVELDARIRRILWRIKEIDNGNVIKHGDLVIDLDKYEVFVAGRLINLSFKEYELLKVLVTNKDRVLTREALLDKVWGYDYFGGDRTVDVHIRRLRSKIEDANHSFIDTVRNVGYKFKV